MKNAIILGGFNHTNQIWHPILRMHEASAQKVRGKRAVGVNNDFPRGATVFGSKEILSYPRRAQMPSLGAKDPPPQWAELPFIFPQCQ